MTAMIQGEQLRKLLFGNVVTRATGALPATTTGGIFTVSGGRVRVTGLTGVVTTGIQAQATTLKVVATPTTGAVNDLSATVDINGLAAGGLLSPTGLAGDALVKSTGGGVSGLRNPIDVAVALSCSRVVSMAAFWMPAR